MRTTSWSSSTRRRSRRRSGRSTSRRSTSAPQHARRDLEGAGRGRARPGEGAPGPAEGRGRHRASARHLRHGAGVEGRQGAGARDVHPLEARDRRPSLPQRGVREPHQPQQKRGHLGALGTELPPEQGTLAALDDRAIRRDGRLRLHPSPPRTSARSSTSSSPKRCPSTRMRSRRTRITIRCSRAASARSGVISSATGTTRSSRDQRNPSHDRIAMTMTTAPTSQMILFMTCSRRRVCSGGLVHRCCARRANDAARDFLRARPRSGCLWRSSTARDPRKRSHLAHIASLRLALALERRRWNPCDADHRRR